MEFAHRVWIFAAFAGLLAFVLGCTSVAVPWSKYEVPDELRFDAQVLSSDMFWRWPQLHYSRTRRLLDVCFNSMDTVTWRIVFGRNVTNWHSNWRTCRYQHNCYRDGHYQVIFCMKYVDYNKPMNVTGFDPKQQPNDSTKQLKLYNTVYGTVVVAIVLSFFFWTHICDAAHWLCAVVGFVRILAQGAFMIIAIIQYRISDELEEIISGAPHEGFIRNNTFLNSITKIDGNGPAFGCSIAFVVLSGIEFILTLVTCVCSCKHKDRSEGESFQDSFRHSIRQNIPGGRNDRKSRQDGQQSGVSLKSTN